MLSMETFVIVLIVVDILPLFDTVFVHCCWLLMLEATVTLPDAWSVDGSWCIPAFRLMSPCCHWWKFLEDIRWYLSWWGHSVISLLLRCYCYSTLFIHLFYFCSDLFLPLFSDYIWSTFIAIVRWQYSFWCCSDDGGSTFCSLWCGILRCMKLALLQLFNTIIVNNVTILWLFGYNVSVVTIVILFNVRNNVTLCLYTVIIVCVKAIIYWEAILCVAKLFCVR